MRISEITRRDVFDALRVQGTEWAGRLDEPGFLERIYDLEVMESYDSRFPNASGDIWQHRINNWDWEPDWVFTDPRFNLMQGDDEVFLRFLCEMVHPVVRSDRQEVQQLVQLFNQFLVHDGFEIIERTQISGRPIYAARRLLDGSPPSVRMAQSTDVFDAQALGQQITRIEASISHDPDLAIGTAKELVETCCKTILEQRGIAVESKWDLPQLVKATYKELKLTPDDIPDQAKAAEVIRRLLSNLATVTYGIAELRNRYGTGHGRTTNAKGLSARHARLVAGAATTLAVFLFETHDERKAEPD